MNERIYHKRSDSNDGKQRGCRKYYRIVPVIPMKASSNRERSCNVASTKLRSPQIQEDSLFRQTTPRGVATRKEATYRGKLRTSCSCFRSAFDKSRSKTGNPMTERHIATHGHGKTSDRNQVKNSTSSNLRGRAAPRREACKQVRLARVTAT